MESPDVAAREYRSTLAELRTNNKTQINLLTILAEDYKEAAAQIVDVIGEHLHTVSPSQKLPVMYVCDSILKNTKKPNEYDKLFSRKIVGMFEHVFKQGDEKVRSSLYKLRVTWASTQLFMPSKLYQLDMKINAMDSAWPISNPDTGRALRNDPAVAPPAPTSSASANSQSGSRGVHVNRKFIEPASAGVKRTSSEKTKTPPSKQETNNQRQIKKEIKKETVDPLDKLLPSASSKGSSSHSKRKAPVDHSNAPNRKKQTVQDEDLRTTSRQSHNQDQDFRQRPLKPTSVAGSHAFSVPARPMPPAVPVPPGANNYPSQPPPFLQPPQPLIPQQHHSSPPQDPAPLMMMPTQQPPPPAPSQPNPSKHVYSSDQAKLDVPANNRIFVEGKAYEVMFIDDTAVIERGGAPHRIYFSGMPRNLIVDGTAHLIPFNTPTEIDICGAKHMVKFGAPSRELYIGGHPFKGQFGGPPILATINGRRHEIRLTGSAPEVRIEPEPAYDLNRFLHKMRKEQKIDIVAEKPKEPVEWMLYLKGLKASGVLPPIRNQTPPQSQSSSSGNQNQHGRGGRHNNRPTPPPHHQSPMWSQNATMMPESIPSSFGVEKRNVPPAAIADFNIRLLQVRYDSVVDRLVTKRLDSCKFCGMRLDDTQGKSKEWQDHMDWHVKQNLAQHGNTAHFRKWYPTAANWLTARASDQPNQDQENARDEPLPGVASTGVMSKECAVCQEKFDEYFDDDEDTWRLRDTVSVHGKIVHAACSADVSLMVADTPTSSEQPFFAHTVKYEAADEEDVKPDVKNLISFKQQNALSSH